MKSENKLVGVGLFTAISASLCCITPVLALLAGSSGIASTFSWLDPLRPYLIGLTVLVLGYAWYQKLKPATPADCNCETEEKPSFLHTRKFLGMVTVFAGVMLAFPLYAHVFYPDKAMEVTQTDNIKIQRAEFSISGMTCAGCEAHVDQELSTLDGILTSSVSYKNGKAIVEFDQSKTNLLEIENTINKTGYSVIHPEESN